MAFNIGTIIAVVAVFDIHIDRNQVGNIIPNINLAYIIYSLALLIN